MTTMFSTSQAPRPVGLYPHSRKIGPWIYLSGIGPRKPDTEASALDVPGLELDASGRYKSFDFEAQVRQVFENVRAVLAQHGADLEHLVNVTVYLTDMKRDFLAFNRLYAEILGPLEHKPCRTTVEVGALPTEIVVELQCVAYLDPIEAGAE
jgi:2-aminomuconate deaminase